MIQLGDRKRKGAASYSDERKLGHFSKGLEGRNGLSGE
jgi:hypothetical protein